MKTIGEKIYELRRKQGLSQEQLGFEINVARQTISKWEANTMQPTTDNIQSLCDFFKVDPNFFLNSSDELTPKDLVAATNSEVQIVTQPASSKKLILLYILLIILSIIVFAFCAIIGGIAIFVTNQPSLGFSEIDMIHMDPLAIVCFVLAGCAFVSLITFIILLIKQKKSHK